MTNLSIKDVSNDLMKTFKGLKIIDTWGETSFFYDPDNLLPRGTYFCTLKEKDGENDKASSLSRGDIFRLNFGIAKPTFVKLFNQIPKRPPKGGIIEGGYDFTKLDCLCPHPVYGWMCWVAIVNPSVHSWNRLQTFLAESYELVLKKHQKKNL